MYTIDGAIAMLNGFKDVCKSLKTSLNKKLVISANYNNYRPDARLRLDDPRWRNLKTDVERVFKNTPTVESYRDRWDTIATQVEAAASIQSSAVEGMEILFHEMIGCLEDLQNEGENKDIMDERASVKFFISHNSADADFCRSLVIFLEGLNILQENIVCTSVPNCGPSVNENIYDWLRNQFHGNLYVLYILSDKYFNSVPCVSEMGAAWVTKKDYTSFILPGFSMDRVAGPIDKNKMAIDLNLASSRIRAALKQFVSQIGVGASERQIDTQIDIFIESIEMQRRGTGELDVNELFDGK